MDIHEELSQWYEKIQKFPKECHLLCPRVSDDDYENYKLLDDPDSTISQDEKKSRIEEGNERLKVTYWNCLIFAFDKQSQGKWGDELAERLNHILKYCPECVFNWHMKRKDVLQQFQE